MKVADRLYLAKLTALGCVICQRPAEVHHLLTGKPMGKKSSHKNAIPLCPDHHRNGGHGVAIHSGVKTWEANFGTEVSHLARVQELLV